MTMNYLKGFMTNPQDVHYNTEIYSMPHTNIRVAYWLVIGVNPKNVNLNKQQ